MAWKKQQDFVFEQICLVTMLFSWSCSILEVVPSLIIKAFIYKTVLYTNFNVTFYFIMYHNITNVNDIGEHPVLEFEHSVVTCSSLFRYQQHFDSGF